MARQAANTVGAVGYALAVVAASTLVTGSSAVLNIRISVGASADAVVGIAVLLETELSFTSLLALTVHADAVSTRLEIVISEPKLSLGTKHVRLEGRSGHRMCRPTWSIASRLRKSQKRRRS